MNTYTACLSLIQRKRYTSKEDMAFKLNVFFLNDQLTQAQYDELISLLNEQ
ncbi:MAG: hypothetical protein ABS939_25065 [Psychrobacillus sp.]